MRALVTGAGGFIGRAVVRTFAAAGYDIVAHVGPVEADLATPPEASTALRSEIEGIGTHAGSFAGCAVAVHLAGPAAVAASFSDPVAYARAHVAGTAAMIAAAKAASIPRFVLISSAEVYGRSVQERVKETDAVAPRSPYAAAKVGAEALALAAARAGGPATVILRPFSVYGPGQRRASLLAEMAAQARAGAGIVVRDARPVRDYCYVDDVARAALTAAAVPVTEAEIFNVGTGVGTTIASLAATLFEALGRSGTVTESGAERGAAEIFRLVADPAHAAATLGWTAQISLSEGIAAMLEEPRT